MPGPYRQRPSAAAALLAALTALLALGPPPVSAASAAGSGGLAARVKVAPELAVGRRVAPLAAVEPSRVAGGWAGYAASLGPAGEIYLDLASGEPALVEGAPEPLLPGRGNSLTLDDLAAAHGRPPGALAAVDAAVVEQVAERWLDRRAPLLAVPRGELALRGAVAAGGALWVVTWEHRPAGVLVLGSRLTLVIGHGNAVLWGSERVFPLAPEAASSAALSADEAQAALAAYAGWDAVRDRLLAVPRRVWLTVTGGPGALSAAVTGRRHRLVWELAMERRGEPGSWLAHVDAGSGEVLRFADADRYGWTRGGIQPTTWSDFEVSRPLPLAGLAGGLAPFASVEGLFTDPGGPVIGSLAGERVLISDRCGTPGIPAVAADGAGNLDFGLGPPNPDGRADCATNGVGENGGAHNTHAARTAYFYATRLKRRGSDWLSANAWLAGQHELQVNIESPLCGGYWRFFNQTNGFYDSSLSPSPCPNGGEIAGLVLHEVGHGLDQNDAQGTDPFGGATTEAYADVMTLFELRSSCVAEGLGFGACIANQTYGCGGDCRGLRELDYARLVSTLPGWVPAPLTAAEYVPGCGVDIPPVGPCGGEAPCEAHLVGSAVWDLAARKLAAVYDPATAWYIVERTWMLAMQAATVAYNCSQPGYVTDGCAATSWFETLLAADDDNGDLTDGTPHAAEIFAAFDDHALACGAAADPGNQSVSACPPLATPLASATPVAGGIELSWPPVAGAAGYLVLKNHGDCERGWLHAAVVPPVAAAGLVTWTDADVADHQGYSYRVVALAGAGGGADNACYSDLSACVRAAVSACPGAHTDPPVLANPVDNRVDVAWDDAGGCAGFSLYRRLGGCGELAEFERLATGLGSSPYVDTAVEGGLAYGYRVAALDPSGSFELDPSPCAEITPTGVCNVEPEHDAESLTAVNALTAACGVELGWSAASAVCPGQSVVYNVYRGTAPGFVPGDGNRIATGVAATGYLDAAVSPGVTYYYAVRAEALSGTGSGPNGGAEEGNHYTAPAAATGPFDGPFADDMESGGTAWRSNTAVGDPWAWALSTERSHSPVTSWHAPAPGLVTDQRLLLNRQVLIPSAASELRFWHGYTVSGNDGGVLEYSTDVGMHWHDVLDGDGGAIPANPARQLENGYDRTVGCCGSPLEGRQVWGGSNTFFSRVRIDLGDFAGVPVLFRWRFATDGSIGGFGWFVDDVEIGEVTACVSPLFTDGFESGDVSAWSSAAP